MRWRIERRIDGTWTEVHPDGYELRREISKPNLLFFRGSLVYGSWAVYFKGDLIATGGRIEARPYPSRRQRDRPSCCFSANRRNSGRPVAG